MRQSAEQPGPLAPDRGEIALGGAYALWRERRSHLPALREKPGTPPERLLQAVWHHQRIRRDQLRLGDGRPVRVLHPGFRNREAGPDFRRAVVQVEGEPPRIGDVEVDLQSACWRQHGHDRNPAFTKVILHVVWEAAPPAFSPTFELKPHLDAPLSELASWLGTDAAENYPPDLAGRCASGLKRLSQDQLTDLLGQAGLARMRRKASDLEARARQAGAEQALWEGILRALGYKHNVWPMLRLGELLPALRAEPPASRLHWQARLFGVSGLLPGDLVRANPGADGYLRRIWDLWWRERDQMAEFTLPAAAWRLSGLRPANHPLRRLALAAHWLTDGQLPAQIDHWFRAPIDRADLVGSLQRMLETPEDPFWGWHWSLRGRRLPQAQPLTGPARITDLAINVFLPWLRMKATLAGDTRLQQEAEQRYFAWPPAEDNAVLRLARNRLLAGHTRWRPGAAALQQGLLQIVRDFCDHSDSLCSTCSFPGCVAELAPSGSA